MQRAARALLADGRARGVRMHVRTACSLSGTHVGPAEAPAVGQLSEDLVQSAGRRGGRGGHACEEEHAVAAIAACQCYSKVAVHFIYLFIYK